MGAFQIIFVAINLALPYWLWTRSTSTSPPVKWEAFEGQLGRVLDASGGFECETGEIVALIKDLCERSGKRLGESESVAFELPAANILYSCEMTQRSVSVTLLPYFPGDAESPCLGKDTHLTLAQELEFVFTLSGYLNRIKFRATNNIRETVKVASCRKKLQKAEHMTAYRSLNEFIDQLGIHPGDPRDYRSANRLCLVYDGAPAWQKLRQQYLEKSE